MTTRIVNVRDYKPYSKYWTNPPTSPYVYIGRNVRFQIPFKSKQHNPYTVEKINEKEVPGSREKVVGVNQINVMGTFWLNQLINKPIIIYDNS